MAMSKEERACYFKDYYEANRALIAEKRRERYRGDPEYKKRLKEYADISKQRKKEERQKLIDSGEMVAPIRRKKKEKTYIVSINGVECVAYSVYSMARRVERSPFTILDWIRRGLIPKTPFMSDKKSGLYTQEMIDSIREYTIGKKYIPVKSGIADEILKSWETSWKEGER